MEHPNDPGFDDIVPDAPTGIDPDGVPVDLSFTDDAEVIDAVDSGVVDADVVDGEVTDAEVLDGDAEGTGADDVARERDDYFDALRRMQADFENYRKRAGKQQIDAIDYATGRIIEDLLPVLDACEAGIEHGDEGVTAVFTALLGTLEKVGLTRLDPRGDEFDPNIHEAVLHEPGDDDDEAEGPVVAEVMRPGYIWKGRVLRAAMVKVRG